VFYWEWKISESKIKRLNQLIETFGYMTYEYKTMEGFATDHPSCITSIEMFDGTFRKVDHYLGDQLWDNTITEFEIKIDQIAGTGKYVKCQFFIFYLHNQSPLQRTEYKGLIVVASNKSEAINLALGEGDVDYKDWVVRKIGKYTEGELFPFVLMKEKY
jgi:hypothetical protein